LSTLSEALECQANGKVAEALVKFSEIVSMEPTNAVAHYSLAALNASLGLHDRALVHIDYAIVINPVFAPSYLAKSKINAALGNLKQSLEDAEKALALDATSAESQVQRDAVKILLSRLTTQNLPASQTSPRSIVDIISEADALAREGNHTAALTLYETYLHVPGQEFAFIILFNMGVILSEAGRNSDAEAGGVL
jgi:tetratricopeptide (TPR) repeat protein